MSRNISHICIYNIYHKCGDLRFINILVPLIISVSSLDFLCSFYALPEGGDLPTISLWQGGVGELATP